MTVGVWLAWPLLTAAGVGAALVAVRLERRWAYGVAKGLASLGFVGVALAVGATAEDWGRWALAALILSAAGDVALAVRARAGFLTGLGLFLIAHAIYVIAFVVRGVDARPLAVAGLVAVFAVTAGWRVWGGRLPEPMRVPVAAYAAVLATMVATGVAAGFAHGAPALVLGVLLVAGSDLAVARERFGTPGFVNKVIGLPAYYLGQVLVAVSIGGT